MRELRIGVVGAGIIGLKHIETILRTPGFRLAGIVDPGPRAGEVAARFGVPLFADLGAMLAARAVDGAVVATPNELHAEAAIALLEAGLPALVEKPVVGTAGEADALLAAIRRTGVPVLVGHHRRHHPIVRAAKAAIDGGLIGRLVAASVICSLYKDEDYFDVLWRRRPGTGGPLMINLIHEVDLMRHLFGDVSSVAALSSNAVRGLEVEDCAGAVLRFAAGGMATMMISDVAVGPWAWDITAGENPARFPAHAAQSHFFAGSEGGLSLPDLAHWSHRGTRSWYHALDRRTLPHGSDDCYEAQLLHFGSMIAGEAEPLVSADEGVRSLATIEAIRKAAQTGRETRVEPAVQA